MRHEVEETFEEMKTSRRMESGEEELQILLESWCLVLRGKECVRVFEEGREDKLRF